MFVPPCAKTIVLRFAAKNQWFDHIFYEEVNQDFLFAIANALPSIGPKRSKAPNKTGSHSGKNKSRDEVSTFTAIVTG